MLEPLEVLKNINKILSEIIQEKEKNTEKDTKINKNNLKQLYFSLNRTKFQFYYVSFRVLA
jgi:hypothetical protein